MCKKTKETLLWFAVERIASRPNLFFLNWDEETALLVVPATKLMTMFKNSFQGSTNHSVVYIKLTDTAITAYRPKTYLKAHGKTTIYGKDNDT